jgi:hypothetical protein
MYYDSDQYEITTGVEIDELLSDLPLDLMKENILAQIQSPISTNTNYLDIILDKYRILQDNYEGDLTQIKNITDSVTDFCQYVLKALNDSLGLGINIDYEDIDIINLTDILYTFFIIKYRRNIIKFFYKYIKENKRSLADYYEKMGKKKDVTTTNYKKLLKNKDDVIILSNLPNISSYIKDLYVESIDFIQYTTDDDNYEGRYVKSLIKQGRLTGNFVQNYLDIVFDDSDYILDEIQVDIKMKLLKKLT